MTGKAIITGATGFIGKNLCGALLEKGCEIIAVTRNEAAACRKLGKGIFCTGWNGLEKFMNGEYSVINLAGENIGSGAWTESKIEGIFESRLEAGERIVEAVKKSNVKPAVFVQASASGYYGSRGDETLTEESADGQDFLSEICRKWEGSTIEVESMGVRRVIIRTAPVLGRNGGILGPMAKPFRFFLGGPLGKGKQWFPWVHIADEVNAIIHLMENSGLNGVFNIAAPGIVTEKEFADALGAALNRPSWLAAPEFLIRLLPGKMGEELLLASRRVSADKLLKSGFKFRFGGLKAALEGIYG
jgi:uncharacterized protein (TIGR01777 family)